MSDAYTRPIETELIEDPGLGKAPESEAATTSRPTSDDQPRAWSRDLRFMLVVLTAIVVLFLAFALLIAFSPTDAAIISLAIFSARSLSSGASSPSSTSSRK